MRRLVLVLMAALILVVSSTAAEAFHFGRWCGVRSYSCYSPCISFGYSCYPARVYCPPVYCRPVCYPRIISYVSPYVCGTPAYSTYYYGYAGTTNYIPSSNYVNYQLPTVSYPAELSYGPQAVKQFMGVDRNFALGSLLNPTDRDALVRPEVTDLKIRATNLSTLQKARNYISMGDDLFRKQKFHSALQQYKAATRFAPDLAEGYFRQGHALIATSNFDLAAQAFKRGLKTDPKISKSDFLLSEIYGDAKIAKTAHLESLASAALDREGDSDLMFLLGVFLHFDGESKRALKFFERASDLAGADNVHLAHFLPRVERRREAPAEPEIHLVGFGRDT